MQPVVRLDSETGKRKLALMRWGLIPYWAKDAKIGLSAINATAETVTTNAAPEGRQALSVFEVKQLTLCCNDCCIGRKGH
jgi:hypothetical protein